MDAPRMSVLSTSKKAATAVSGAVASWTLAAAAEASPATSAELFFVRPSLGSGLVRTPARHLPVTSDSPFIEPSLPAPAQALGAARSRHLVVDEWPPARRAAVAQPPPPRPESGG